AAEAGTGRTSLERRAVDLRADAAGRCVGLLRPYRRAADALRVDCNPIYAGVVGVKRVAAGCAGTKRGRRTIAGSVAIDVDDRTGDGNETLVKGKRWWVIEHSPGDRQRNREGHSLPG